MNRFLRVSPTLIVLSAWDVFYARFFMLTSLAYIVMLPSLVLIVLCMNSLLPKLVLLSLPILVFTSLLLIGRWTALVDNDIKNGNNSPASTLLGRTFKDSPFQKRIPPVPAWGLISILISITFSILSLSSLFQFIPLLLILFYPLWPFLSLICITGKQLTTPTSSSDSNPLTQNSDRTRPMSSFIPRAADATVAAVAETNPAGFIWTENNRQALMMDILSGQLNFEDAQKKYGLKTKDLKKWMKDYLQQNQAPSDQERDLDRDPDLPA